MAHFVSDYAPWMPNKCVFVCHRMSPCGCNGRRCPCVYEMVVYISKAHRNLHRNICLEKRQGQKNLRMCQILMILSFFVWNPKFLRFPKMQSNPKLRAEEGGVFLKCIHGEIDGSFTFLHFFAPDVLIDHVAFPPGSV